MSAVNLIGYVIVDATDFTELENKVRDYLKGGWMPQGGICVCVNQCVDSRGRDCYDINFYQAMVMDADREVREWTPQVKGGKL